jgi:hypothetical protein
MGRPRTRSLLVFAIAVTTSGHTPALAQASVPQLTSQESQDCLTAYRVVRVLRGEIDAVGALRDFRWPKTYDAVQKGRDNWEKREKHVAEVGAISAPDADAAFAKASDVAGLIRVSVAAQGRPVPTQWLTNVGNRISACDRAFSFTPPLEP